MLLLVILSLCLLSPEMHAGETAENQNASHSTNQNNFEGVSASLNVSSDVSQEFQWFSGRFGFSDVAGRRSFLPVREAKFRIIGGQEAPPHSWPWQVSLMFGSTPACGGAIISPQWVVSAAHCFRRYRKASFWTVVAGKHDLENPKEDGQQLVGVSSIILHHSYDSRTKVGDVALLRLQYPLTFDPFVRPIDLWMTPLPPVRTCTVTGWGATRENGPRVTRLQEVNVTLMPPETCSRYYKNRVRTAMFCAGKDQGGVDACQGDSGGPLSCFTGSRHRLLGVVSWGIGCGRARRPGVYTRIQDYARWMEDTMDKETWKDSEDLPSEEGRCGAQQHTDCLQTVWEAELQASPDGDWLVGNVSEACPTSWPWMVSLQANGRHYCSGVLLHPHWVLTAKHCSVRAKEDVLVLGVYDVKFLSTQTVLVDRVVDPEQDFGFPPRFDLSLLRLAAPARTEANVSPVCVPEEDEELDESWSCITAGWGPVKSSEDLNPDRLHHAGLTLVNETSCRQKWGDFISDSHICAHPVGSAACMGDSGAPLFCQKRGTYFLFGIISWGSFRCDADKPAVFTRVSDFSSWIHEIMNDLQR